MYTIAFLKVRAFQLSKRHISTIHNLELCTSSHSSQYELFNCPNVISQQSTIYSYVHHRIPRSTNFSIVQTSYLNNAKFRVMYTIAFLKVRDFQLSKRHISTIHNLELCTPSHSSKYEIFICPNVISLLAKLPKWWHWVSLLRYAFYMVCKKVAITLGENGNFWDMTLFKLMIEKIWKCRLQSVKAHLVMEVELLIGRRLLTVPQQTLDLLLLRGKPLDVPLDLTQRVCHPVINKFRVLGVGGGMGGRGWGEQSTTAPTPREEEGASRWKGGGGLVPAQPSGVHIPG